MAPPAHLDPGALAARAARSAGPFSGDHLVGLWAANVLGAALVFAGWWEVSGIGQTSRQLGWLNLSLVGLIIAGGANGLWLARGRQTVTLARSAVLAYPPGGRTNGSGAAFFNGNSVASAQLALRFRPAPAEAGRARPSQAGMVTEGLVSGTNMTRYHRSDCLLVAGKEVRVGSRAQHEGAGRVPCDVCQP